MTEGEPSADDLESMTVMSEEAPEITEEQQEVDDEKMYTNMPWLRVAIIFTLSIETSQFLTMLILKFENKNTFFYLLMCGKYCGMRSKQ